MDKRVSKGFVKVKDKMLVSQGLEKLMSDEGTVWGNFINHSNLVTQQL